MQSNSAQESASWDQRPCHVNLRVSVVNAVGVGVPPSPFRATATDHSKTWRLPSVGCQSAGSWNDKSWVVGVTVHGENKAYDWNRLRRDGVVNDVLGGTPIVLALASDHFSFFAFERPDSATHFVLRDDSLVAAGQAYALSGQGRAGTLKSVRASQEFWHSWRTFHPGTKTF